MKNLCIVLFLLFGHLGIAARSTLAVTVNGTNTGAIPDGTGSNVCGAPRDINFAVSGAPTPSLVSSVSFSGSHTFIGDLQVILIAPDATQFVIFSYVGRQNLTGDFGDDSNLNGTYTFQDSASANIWAVASAPAAIVGAGSYRTQAPGPFANDNPGPPLTSLMGAFMVLNPNNAWTLRFLDCAATDTGTISAATITLVGPTAAAVSISGRVVSATGRGVGRARITVSGPDLAAPVIVITNPFGYFSVASLSAGQTYIVEVSSKQYAFSVPARALTANEDLTGVEFIADP